MDYILGIGNSIILRKLKNHLVILQNKGVNPAFDEDRSQIRTGNGPRIMATIRNIVLSILRLLGVANITECLRKNALDHSRIFRTLGLA